MRTKLFSIVCALIAVIPQSKAQHFELDTLGLRISGQINYSAPLYEVHVAFTNLSEDDILLPKFPAKNYGYSDHPGKIILNYGFVGRWSDPLMMEHGKEFYQIVRPGKSFRMKKATRKYPVTQITLMFDFFRAEEVYSPEFLATPEYAAMDSIYFRVYELVRETCGQLKCVTVKIDL